MPTILRSVWLLIVPHDQARNLATIGLLCPRTLGLLFVKANAKIDCVFQPLVKVILLLSMR